MKSGLCVQEVWTFGVTPAGSMSLIDIVYRMKRPLNEQTWFNIALLVAAVLAMIFGAIGPVFAPWVTHAPEILQWLAGILSKYGLYLGIALLVIVAYAKRVLIAQLVRAAAAIVQRLYGLALRLALGPVLESRRAPVLFGQKYLLQHFTTGQYLTSLAGQNYNHAKSSTQQKVFTTPIPDRHSIWVVEFELGNPKQRALGAAIPDGDIIRIRHVETGSFLHSHTNPASSSSAMPANAAAFDIQREVSSSHQNNPEDNWRVDASGAFVTAAKIRFTHTSSTYHLHSHDMALSIAGRSQCFEVTCCIHRNDDDFWILSAVDNRPLPQG